MRFSDLFRPLILQSHRSALMVEFYEILSRAVRHDPSLVQTLQALEKDTLRWRWYDHYLVLAPFAIAAFWLWFVLVGESIYGLPVGILGVVLGVAAALSVMLILGSGRVWRDDYVGLLARRLRRAIEKGQTLSGAMQEHSGWFEPNEIVMVRVGERSGKLPQVFRNLSRFSSTMVELHSHANFLVYPLILFLWVATVASFILTIIMPKFVDIFDQLKIPLPGWTLALLSLHGHLIQGPLAGVFGALLACVAVPFILPFSGNRIGAFLIFAWCVLCAAGIALAAAAGGFQVVVSPDSFGVIVAVIFWTVMAAGGVVLTAVLAIGMYQAIAKVMRSGVGVFGSLFRSIPLLDRFARPLAMARFLSALGVLLEARAPLPESLTLAAQTSGLGALWRAVYRARLRLEQGQSLAAALEPEPFIPLRLRRLLDLAEKNGTLPEQCQRLAEWCHDDAEHWAHRLCAVLEPMTSIVMGALVLSILLGLYLPLFRLPVEMMKKQDDYPRIQAQVWKGP